MSQRCAPSSFLTGTDSNTHKYEVSGIALQILKTELGACLSSGLFIKNFAKSKDLFHSHFFAAGDQKYIFYSF